MATSTIKQQITMQREVVWTNPNPTSAMGTSTLNLTFDKKPKFLIIVARIHIESSSNYLTTMTIPYATGSYVMNSVRYDGTANYMFGRRFTLNIDNNRVATDAGYGMATYGNFSSQNSKVIVPLLIYGIS